MIIATLGSAAILQQFKLFHKEAMLSKLVADLIKEICRDQKALQILYKNFYPFLFDILHTITTKQPQLEKNEMDNFEIQNDEENTMEAVLFSSLP